MGHDGAMTNDALYDHDLAAVHEADFTAVASGAARTLLAALDRAGHRTGTVVDLGCGGGTLAARLVDAGYDVLGVDLSPAMVELARAAVPAATFVQGSVWDVELPEAIAVSAVGEVVNYAADPRAGLEQLRTLAARVHAALRPGGVFLLDIATPGRGGPEGSRAALHDADDHTLHFSARESVDDDGQAMLERRMILFTRDGDRYRRADEVHRLRLYETATVTDLLRATGFDVALLGAYDDEPLPDGWIAIAATRPRSTT
jgi:SAM-dependent methyltransferase